MQEELLVLMELLSQKAVLMDPARVEAINSWPDFVTVLSVQFLWPVFILQNINILLKLIHVYMLYERRL